MSSTIKLLKLADNFGGDLAGNFDNFSISINKFYYNKLPRFVSEAFTNNSNTITDFSLVNVDSIGDKVTTDVIKYAFSLNTAYISIDNVTATKVRYFFQTDYIQDLDSGYYYYYLRDSEGNERKSEIFYIINESINDGLLNEEALNLLTEISQFLIPEGNAVYSIKISALPVATSYTVNDRVLIYKPNEALSENQLKTIKVSDVIGNLNNILIWGSDTLFSDFYTNNNLDSINCLTTIILKKETDGFRIDSVVEIPVYQNFEKIQFNGTDDSYDYTIYLLQDVVINCLPNLYRCNMVVQNTNKAFCVFDNQEFSINLYYGEIDTISGVYGIDLNNFSVLKINLFNFIIYSIGKFVDISEDSELNIYQLNAVNYNYRTSLSKESVYGITGSKFNIYTDCTSLIYDSFEYINFSGTLTFFLLSEADKISYDNSASTLDSIILNDAIDELDNEKENVSNKENTTLDNSTTKYPTNNLVKTTTDLKQTVFVGICASCPISSTDIDIDYTNRTLTIARVGGVAVSASNPIRFFVDGNGISVKHEKTTAQVFTWTDISGLWYFYFDNNGDPIATQTQWTDFDLIATVFRMTWNSAKSPDSAKAITHWVEYHLNDISSKDHLWKHTQGAIWITGGTSIHNAIASGAPNADGRNTCFSLTSVYLMDDNLLYDVTNSTDSDDFNQDLGNTNAGLLTLSNSGIFNIRYKGVASASELVIGSRFPFLWNSGTNIPEYVDTSGNRQPVSNNYFFVYILYALQDNRTGQAVRLTPAYAQYSTLSAAQAVTWATIQAQDTAANDGEIRPLYKLIFEYKSSYNAAVKYSALREVTDIRKQVVTQATNSGGSIPASSVTVVPAGNISSTDALNALYELDTEKLVASTAANSVKANNTASTASATDVALSTNQVLGRLASNIQAIDICNKLEGYGTLVAGQCTITDSLITTSSVCVGWCYMDSNHSSVPITATANSGNMVFSTGQAGDTAKFGYSILC